MRKRTGVDMHVIGKLILLIKVAYVGGWIDCRRWSVGVVVCVKLFSHCVFEVDISVFKSARCSYAELASWNLLETSKSIT